MSRTYNAPANTKNKNSRTNYLDYLGHNNEPQDENLSDGASTELSADLIWNSYYQKRKLRRAAKRLRHVSYN